jgi:RNA polymerase sigma factor (sigma-70 family)
MDGAVPITKLMNEEVPQQADQVVSRMGQRLTRFIRARVASEPDAEDILQDVWQQLISTLAAGPIEQVSAWLYAVARNRIIDQYRKPKMASLDGLAAGAEREDERFELPAILWREDATPETEYQCQLFWQELQAALAELPGDQRQVFIWHELEGLSFQEIAELTGDNVNTLLSRKRYAVLYLRQSLEEWRNQFNR